MTSGLVAIGAVGSLLAAGCRGSEGVTIGAVETSPPSSTEAVAVATPTSPEPVAQRSVGDYPPDSWWSEDLEELGTAMQGCETGSGPFRDEECAFMGLLSIGTEGLFGVLVEEHKVDLVSSAYDMCRQLDEHPDLDGFLEHVQAPPTWPPPGDDWPPAHEGDIMLMTLTMTAGQTLCPHHLQLVSSFMTPRTES